MNNSEEINNIAQKLYVAYETVFRSQHTPIPSWYTLNSLMMTAWREAAKIAILERDKKS